MEGDGAVNVPAGNRTCELCSTSLLESPGKINIKSDSLGTRQQKQCVAAFTGSSNYFKALCAGIV